MLTQIRGSLVFNRSASNTTGLCIPTEAVPDPQITPDRYFHHHTRFHRLIHSVSITYSPSPIPLTTCSSISDAIMRNPRLRITNPFGANTFQLLIRIMWWIIRADEDELKVFLSLFRDEFCACETYIVVDFLEFGEVWVVHVRGGGVRRWDEEGDADCHGGGG